VDSTPFPRAGAPLARAVAFQGFGILQRAETRLSWI